MTSNTLINNMFYGFQKHLEQQSDVRQAITRICKQTDILSRTVSTSLELVHHSEESVIPACLEARELFEKAREGYQKLIYVVPPGDYFKYYPHWQSMTQRYCFLIALTIWLESGFLATHETIAEMLGINSNKEVNGFHLPFEDYLVGLIMLCSELPRLTVNLASRGDYHRVLQISKFIMDINTGFRLLGLEDSDMLRKRSDGLKFSVKRIESVVYDLSLRGLLKDLPEATSTKTTTSQGM